MLVELDGSHGEGGGQILRTALSLAMCTGKPLRIVNIRAKRKAPGLMRQHLTAVLAAAEICGAEVRGAQVGSQTLSFTPGPIRGGDYQFAIGTAGSCTLVLQTVLPALLQADQPSRVILRGGTHNPMAPPYHFLARAFVPVLRQMGAVIELELARCGFYPAGGGEFSARITPALLRPVQLDSPGERLHSYAEALLAALPLHIAERELSTVGKRMGWADAQLILRSLPKQHGPGNALLLTLEQTHVTEVFVGFGEKGVAAETVAERLVQAVRDYRLSGAAVGPYLADQLLLPLALAGGGSFTASDWTPHAATNAEVIQRFLPVRIQHEAIAHKASRIVVAA